MKNKTILTAAVAGLAAVLAIGGGVLIYRAAHNNTQTPEPSSSEVQFETTQGEAKETTAELATSAATEVTAAETTEAPTEPATEPETEAELSPLNEVQVDGKGNESGFFTDYYSDHSVIISGVITDGSYGLTTYDDVNGSHESVMIPASVNGYTVRAISIASLASGYSSLEWNGVKAVSVPTGMKFTIDYQTEITFEDAAPYFEKCGISLTVY